MDEAYSGIEIPDAITPFIGVRAWKIAVDYRQQERLSSIYRTAKWPVGRRLDAKCIRMPHLWMYFPTTRIDIVLPDPQKVEPHTPPFDGCLCGIYALKYPLQAKEPAPWTSDTIMGLVFLWGKVLEGERGFRSQYARVAALAIDEQHRGAIERLSESYGVPVVPDIAEALAQQRLRQIRSVAL